jgi:hypothetical protein
MLQALIKGRAQEDHHFKTFACEAVVHDFVTVALVSKLVKLTGDVVYCLTLERSSITFIAVERRNFAQDALN